MRKFIWIFLVLVASVFIYRIAGDKKEKMPRLENRSIQRDHVQAVNNTGENTALKIDEKATSLALILGGMPFNTAGNQMVTRIFDQKATKTHITAIEGMWKTLEADRLKKMRTWSSSAIDHLNNTSHQLIYPLSGPDFLHAYTLFPNCDEYILLGAEPIGTLPALKDLKENELNAYLGNVRNALRLFSQRGYFSSVDMQQHLSKLGVLPVLNVLLARTDNHISNIEYVTLDKQSIETVIDENKAAQAEKNNLKGVRIEFLNVAKTRKQSLLYIQTDLSQEKNQQVVTQLMNALNHPIAMLKTAGYWLHQPGFATLQKAILDHAEVCVQDDSGIPLQAFAKDAQRWSLSFYGRYVGAPAMYNKLYYQKGLRQKYNTRQNIKALPFAFGYLKQGANLLVATRKK
ncbi:hypothetical protein [uncultured Microscilla sp.]|uniref:hypothetical protein n=1 Tax=uncultured Microscilla sp. TaxID=432653 RepID=UPI0026062995|nr:hypothetical protein [uncultured Microscilla sp.]